MRDELDPGTIEMQLPKRRGRPALNGVAMSDAERAKAYRTRKKDAPRYSVQTDLRNPTSSKARWVSTFTGTKAECESWIASLELPQAWKDRGFRTVKSKA